MRIVAIAGATGGSGKTTTAISLARMLKARGHKTGIIELSPWPSARLLLGEGKHLLLDGRVYTTETAIRAALAPYKDSPTVFLMDTPRLDDSSLARWTPFITHLLLCIRADRQSLRGLPGINSGLESLRRTNPGMRFLGFLPTMVKPGDEGLISVLDKAVPGYTIPVSVPHDRSLAMAAQSHAYPDDVAIAASKGEAESALERLAVYTEDKLDLPAPVPQESTQKEKGLVSRLWKLAAAALGPRVTVAGGRNA